MITYLHHTDPALPHYRGRAWTYARGAAATMDRDFLGWMGRFFLHDVAHYHVVHHFFPKMPFCQSPFLLALLLVPLPPSLVSRFLFELCCPFPYASVSVSFPFAPREHPQPLRWARCFHAPRIPSR